MLIEDAPDGWSRYKKCHYFVFQSRTLVMDLEDVLSSSLYRFTAFTCHDSWFNRVWDCVRTALQSVRIGMMLIGMWKDIVVSMAHVISLLWWAVAVVSQSSTNHFFHGMNSLWWSERWDDGLWHCRGKKWHGVQSLMMGNDEVSILL